MMFVSNRWQLLYQGVLRNLNTANTLTTFFSLSVHRPENKKLNFIMRILLNAIPFVLSNPPDPRLYRNGRT